MRRISRSRVTLATIEAAAIAGAFFVPVHDRAMRGRRRAEAEAVDQARVRRRREGVQDLAHRGEVRLAAGRSGRSPRAG